MDCNKNNQNNNDQIFIVSIVETLARYENSFRIFIKFFLKIKLVYFFIFRSKESPANDTKCNTTERGQNTDDVTLIKDDHGDVSTSIERRKRGYWRRMMCATVPLQAVFLSSLFLSWALDPEINGNNCGYNTGNLMNMLYPQLRYVNGPPPI